MAEQGDLSNDEDIFDVPSSDLTPEGALIQFTDSELETLNAASFYHDVDRFLAECLLLQGGSPGAFILRPAKQLGVGAALCVSARGSKSVQHYLYRRTVDGRYKLESHQQDDDVTVFLDVQNLIEYLKNAPIFGVTTGVDLEPELTIKLLYPYPRNTETLSLYEKVTMRASSKSSSGGVAPISDAAARASIAPATTREGYLMKVGAIHRNWNTRFFVLEKQTLSYYKQNPKDQPSLKPLRSIDLNKCTDVKKNDDPKLYADMKNSFVLVSPGRTFYFCATQEEELQNWIEAIRFNMPHLKRTDSKSKE